MVLAPAVGLGIGALAAGLLLLLRHLTVEPLLAGTLAVALLAVLTRALHLDGLADTADGLGSARRGDEALAVMRRSDIGPFGVVTLLLVLLTQATVLGHSPARLALLAVITGRAAIPLACRRGVPAARIDGLGAAVAGTVGSAAAAAVVLLTVACGAALLGWRGALAAVTALLLGEALRRRCTSRFGGITGDVLGALVETATTCTMLAWTLVAALGA